MWGVVNLVWLKVYHRASTFVCSTFALMQHVAQVRQRQMILVISCWHLLWLICSVQPLTSATGKVIIMINGIQYFTNDPQDAKRSSCNVLSSYHVTLQSSATISIITTSPTINVSDTWNKTNKPIEDSRLCPRCTIAWHNLASHAE